MKILRACFSIACFSSAIAMVGYWLYKFWRNDDLCLVDYKLFEDSDDIEYPMLSFCLLNPVMYMFAEFFMF